jgi:5-oxoprolinase (ATP-hydrolysing)
MSVSINMKECLDYPSIIFSLSRGLISDLKAQSAANLNGIRPIRNRIKEYSLNTVQKYMDRIQDNAEKVVRNPLSRIYDEFGGLPVEAAGYLAMCLKIDILWIHGTTDGLLGNPNAPRAITFSAILYALRSLFNEDIPLNQGYLAPIEVIHLSITSGFRISL